MTCSDKEEVELSTQVCVIVSSSQKEPTKQKKTYDKECEGSLLGEFKNVLSSLHFCILLQSISVSTWYRTGFFSPWELTLKKALQELQIGHSKDEVST